MRVRSTKRGGVGSSVVMMTECDPAESMVHGVGACGVGVGVGAASGELDWRAGFC